MGKGKRNEVGQLGCAGIKEVGEMEGSGRVDDEGVYLLFSFFFFGPRHRLILHASK